MNRFGCTLRAWVFLVLFPYSVIGSELSPGAGATEVTHNGRAIPVWYFLPQETKATTPILFVMHGVNRDADRYRDDWMPHAEKYDFILVVPEFSSENFRGEAGYNSGNTFDNSGQLRPRKDWTFSFIEPIFDAIKKSTNNRSECYSIYGHSAGAQFVHRFLYFMPEARVKRAVAANAGWWTMPETDVAFPYGLENSSIDAIGLKAMLGRPLIVLLGTADTDPNHRNLRRTPEAMKQGPHRFARGHAFYDTGRRVAMELDVPFHWQLSTAAGVGHSDKGMSEYAVRILFDLPRITP